MPKSGEQEDQVAPMLVAASMAMIACGMLGMKAHHAIPGFDPHGAQGVGHTRHLVVELGIGHLHGCLPFPLEDQGHPVVPVAKQVFGEIQMRP